MLTILASVLALAGNAGAVSSTGIRGVVLRGPTKPVCEEGMACTAPAVGVGLVFSRGGKDVGRVLTNRLGRFSLPLAPGFYAVRTTRPEGFAGKSLLPRKIRIPAGHWVSVRFNIDTGIR